MPSSAVISLSNVTLKRDGQTILNSINWTVLTGERWVILGPNGSGKTTLCKLAGLYMHPSHGNIDVMGKRLGRTDVRLLRAKLGFTSQALADMMRPSLSALEIVMTGRHAALTPWWHNYGERDRERATSLLKRFNCEALSNARYATLSAGERQRVMLARALMSDPPLLILDEPTAGLDLTGREQLISLLARLADNTKLRGAVLVTHHVDEIPPGFTHILLLGNGRLVAQGPIRETLTPDVLSECFGIPLQLEHRDNRWTAWSSG